MSRNNFRSWENENARKVIGRVECTVLVPHKKSPEAMPTVEQVKAISAVLGTFRVNLISQIFRYASKERSSKSKRLRMRGWCGKLTILTCFSFFLH